MIRGSAGRGKPRFLIVIGFAAALVLAFAACKPPKIEVRPGVLTVANEQQSSWVRNFHPFLPGGVARWGTSAGIYEPLLIFNRMTGDYVPWLATGYEWHEGATGLTFTIREGVKWSDGEPFGAADVHFTFKLLKAQPGMDYGVWKNLESVELDEEGRVVFRFQRPSSTGLLTIAHLPIVPEHIWSKIEEPVSFANPNPVGTGPFTEILSFTSQVYELGRNPHYWKEGYPKIEALRFPAFPTNEQVTLALINGEVDWAGSFVPAIDRIFVGKDPEHHHYWFPTVAGSIFLFPSQGVPAFRDEKVRKALSLAIDRERVIQVAMYEYTRAAEPDGLSPGYQKWRNPNIKPEDNWVRHDPKAAGELLEAAGLKKGADGFFRNADGTPLELELSVIAGWSDWVRACQVMSRNLRDVGIDVTVRAYDQSAWFEKVQNGEFDLSMGWTGDGDTPWRTYNDLMSNETVEPFGESSFVNWHRFGDDEATELLQHFETLSDFEERKLIAWRLAELFIAKAPAIPIFLNPSWGECNTKRFVGWPSPENPYVRLSTNHPPETLLVMTRVEPAPKEGP